MMLLQTRMTVMRCSTLPTHRSLDTPFDINKVLAREQPNHNFEGSNTILVYMINSLLMQILVMLKLSDAETYVYYINANTMDNTQIVESSIF